jgi:hypothetical protein
MYSSSQFNAYSTHQKLASSTFDDRNLVFLPSTRYMKCCSLVRSGPCSIETCHSRHQRTSSRPLSGSLITPAGVRLIKPAVSALIAHLYHPDPALASDSAAVKAVICVDNEGWKAVPTKLSTDFITVIAWSFRCELGPTYWHKLEGGGTHRSSVKWIRSN